MSETEIVPTSTVANVRKALAKPKASVGEVLKVARPEAYKLELAETPLPQNPGLNEEAWDAIEQVAGLLGALELPEHRRQMTKGEREQVTRVYEQLQKAMEGLNRARDQIKIAAFNHADAEAAAQGKITDETQFTKEGWAIVEDKTSMAVPGLDKKLTREVSGGKVTLPLENLQGLVEDEKIDSKDFYAMTRQVRVVDEDRVLAWLRKNPEKAEVLAEATEIGRATASFWLRDNK
jgi:hypothetical protein